MHVRWDVREAFGMCIFLGSVVGSPNFHHCLHVFYHTLTCTMHVDETTLRPAASRSLFLDVQLVTLLGQFILFARANLY